MNNSATCVARAGQAPWIKKFLAPADRGSVNECENCHYFYCLPDRPPGTAPRGEPAARMGQLHPVCRAHVGRLSPGDSRRARGPCRPPEAKAAAASCLLGCVGALLASEQVMLVHLRVAL